MKKNNKIKWLGLFILVLGIVLACVFLDKNMSQCIYIVCMLGMGAWLLVQGIKIQGIPQILALLGSTVGSFFIKILANTTIVSSITDLYNRVFEQLGIDLTTPIENELALTITFWLLFIASLVICKVKENIDTRVKKENDDEEFKQRNYAERSELFCKSLRQRLEAINRENDWSENLFTPIDAEVEMYTKEKRKKKFDDLLKCIKSIYHKNKIFLVLGEPGAGKSVALRKLCLELLDESKKSKKIPVYINLKKWNKDWHLEHLPTKNDLIEFIEATLRENGDFFIDEYLDNYFKKMLENGGWYFIFDSFDEMPCLMGKQNCQELIDRISDLLYQFMSAPNQNGGVIASRLYKAPSEAIGATVTLKMQEFSDIKIKTMLQKYLTNAEIVVDELFGRREDLVVLCRNPFYLSLLISYIKDRSMNFPENQMELYKSFVKGRLKKCAGKLESEHMTVEEVHKAAQELSVFMQNSKIYGLECPATALYKEKGEEYWRKQLKMLEYAKICRFGGTDETVSFVHRRFQEFFLVENIFERKQSIDYEEYKSILNNSGMRDALVLYCEVAEEKKAKEIARFCWESIQKNATNTKNILDTGEIELVNALYFMTEAFRNRKSVICDFIEEFEQLVENKLNRDTDLVILLAFANSMVLFEEECLQDMVLRVFQLKNRWLSDVVMQNCRIIKRLDNRIESQFVSYFTQLDIRTYIERFRNVQFSLSLSHSFRYIRIVHLMFFVLGFLCVSVAGIIGITTLLQGNQYMTYMIQMLNSIYRNGIEMKEVIQELEMATKPGYFDFKIYALTAAVVILVGFLYGILSKQFRVIDYFTCIILIEIMLCITSVSPLSRTLASGCILVLCASFITLVVMLMVHNIYGLIQQKKWQEKLKKEAGVVKKLFWFYVIYLPVIYLVNRFGLFFAIIVIVLIVGGVLLLAVSGFLFIKDYMKDKCWIKKQPDLRSMSRKMLACNLEKLHTQKCKRIYVEELLQKKITLTGTWPNDVRPKYNDDRLELDLAKLDCNKLESCNYLF